MTEERRTRLNIIDDTLGLDEEVHFDVLALLFDPGNGLKKREAEGTLVLTDRRLVFGTSQHGILVDVPGGEIRTPVLVTNKYMMARLIIETDARHVFVLNKNAARDIAVALNKAASA